MGALTIKRLHKTLADSILASGKWSTSTHIVFRYKPKIGNYAPDVRLLLTGNTQDGTVSPRGYCPRTLVMLECLVLGDGPRFNQLRYQSPSIPVFRYLTLQLLIDTDCRK